MSNLMRWRKSLPVAAVVGASVLLVVAAVALFVLLSAGAGGDAMMDLSEVQYGDMLYSIYALDVSHPASVSPSLSLPQPQIELPASFGNMGRVAYGQEVDKVFLVRNIGQSPLTVHNIYSTCTFVTAQLTSAVISPGKAALLTVTLHADEYPDESGALIRRGVVLHTDDPLQAETTVWVQARITR